MRSTSIRMILTTALMLTTLGLRPVHSLDAEALTLQAQMLCQTVPSQCAGLRPTLASPASATPSPAPRAPVARPDTTERACDRIEERIASDTRGVRAALDRDAQTACRDWKAYKEQIGQTDTLCASLEDRTDMSRDATMERDRIRKTVDCTDWIARKDEILRALRGKFGGSASSSSTVDCVTTRYDGYAASHLTTTCTSY